METELSKLASIRLVVMKLMMRLMMKLGRIKKCLSLKNRLNPKKQ